MAAPVGNEFWKLRSKHGRDKIFSDPDAMWESACDYFQWCVDNPITQQNWVGKDGDEVERKLARPFTLTGLAVYFDCEERSLRNYGTQEEYKDFFPVVTRIEQIIRTQKFEGAAVGIFNANIIARDLGLADKNVLQGDKDNPLEGKFEITLNLNK